MFKPIYDAIELDPRLIDDPRILNEEIQKAVKVVKENLKENSDYSQAYNNLLFIFDHTSIVLTDFVSRYQEAES